MGAGPSQEDAAPQVREEPTGKTIPQISNTDSRSRGTIAQVRMPHNYEAIIKDADSTVDNNFSSIDKLYDQLQAGVFLNQKRKKYWVERKSNSNCFMLYSRDLSITWGEDPRYWNWLHFKETSDVLIEAAKLLNVTFVVMLKDLAYGWEVLVNLRLVLPDGNIQQHAENLGGKPRNRWIEIPAGKFKTSPKKIGGIEVSLYEYKDGCWKRGLVVKGVVIRPKD
ncbi:hypothetical protein U1Q18_010160 [Sarracenia purpurea var. burkii]